VQKHSFIQWTTSHCQGQIASTNWHVNIRGPLKNGIYSHRYINSPRSGPYTDKNTATVTFSVNATAGVIGSLTVNTIIYQGAKKVANCTTGHVIFTANPLLRAPHHRR
jgi:hypothetical protein